MSMRVLLSAVLMACAALAAETPLIISDFVPGAASHVRVANASQQPVTAWSLAATSPTSTGTHREVFTTDGYLSEITQDLPNAAKRLERLMPGESRDLPLGSLPGDARLDVVAVVLDDGTAVGEEAPIASIFANRVKERDALKSVADAFDAVLPSTHGAAALAALKDRFAALVDRDDSVPCHAALDAVQAYERKAGAAEIDASLRKYADFVRREYELAAKHSQRRPG
jgi:hypothetical protein